ncbi:uncharacterized protein LOC134248584 [Saccostrea cucullata]|uniref:uncharacterized protein LOC134248584 n=1 Tax=Saccostrea cuccullata TaxID=36930 RepID=UPI002ED642C8
MNAYLTELCLAYLIVLCHIYKVSCRCQPNKEKMCCYGYFFDGMSNDCKECPLGYMGLNCSFPCRYPSYGYSCQNKCICPEEYCDISTGCKERKVVEGRLNSARNNADLKSKLIPNQTAHPAKETMDKPNKSKSESQTTTILIGAVVALSLILLATGLMFSWKRVKQTCLRNKREDTNMPNIKVELKRITCDYEDMKENLYEDLDEKETCDNKEKKNEGNAENDYIDTLKITKMGGNKNDERESKHFYDALK